MSDQLKHSLTVTNNTQYHKNPDNTTSPVTELTFMVGHNIIKCWYYHYEKTFILANEIEKYYNNYIPKNHYSNMFLEKIVKVNSNICAPSVMYEQRYGIHINPVHLLKVDYSEVRIWTDHQLHNLYIYNDNKFVNLEDYLQQQYKHLFELHNESKTNTAQTNILTDPAQKNNNKNTCSMEVSIIIGDCPVESSIIKSIYYFDKNTFTHKDSVVPYGALVNNAVYDNVFNFNIRPEHFVILACGNRINGEYESFIRGQRVCHTAPNDAVLPVFIAIYEKDCVIPKLHELYISKDNSYYILISELNSDMSTKSFALPLREYLMKFKSKNNINNETFTKESMPSNEHVSSKPDYSNVYKSASKNIKNAILKLIKNCWYATFIVIIRDGVSPPIKYIVCGYENRIISIKHFYSIEEKNIPMPFVIVEGKLLLKDQYLTGEVMPGYTCTNMQVINDNNEYVNIVIINGSQIPKIIINDVNSGTFYYNDLQSLIINKATNIFDHT